MRRAMRTVSVLIFLAILGAWAACRGADDLAGPRTVMPAEPGDVYASNPASSLPEFDRFCWEAFLTLNAAASPTTRGLAVDGTAAKSGPEARTTWMTWKSIDDVFPPGGGPSSPWTDGGEAPPGGRFRIHALASLAKTPLGEINLPGAAANTFIGPVIAQNRTYARFEIRFNRMAYQHILDKKLYDYHYLPGKGEIPEEFPAGSIMVKAAWRLVDPGESKFKGRCFWTTALIRDPFDSQATPREADVALVGLHAVYRTSKRRQWIWSSFEQVDNVPGPTGPEAGKAYSFNYGVDYRGDPPENLDANAPPGSKPNIPTKSVKLGPEGPGGPRPTQVRRLQQVHPKTEETNALYQAALSRSSSAWQYYKLVVTQYPSKPDDVNAPLEGVPFPGAGGKLADGSFVSVANTTMETYFQNGNSCMECHQGAKNYGVSFVFSLGRALEKSPPAARMLMARAIMRDSLQPPTPTPGEAGDLRHRVRVLETDRDVLAQLLLRLTTPLESSGAELREGRALAPHAALATPTKAIDYVRDVRPVFLLAISRWKARNLNCPPDVIGKHGAAFGWVNNEPWATWDVLKGARFSPDGPPGSGTLIVDPSANTVRDMLLIRVLRPNAEALARSQQMPLGGPYLTDDEIDIVERFLSQQFGDKPIHP